MTNADDALTALRDNVTTIRRIECAEASLVSDAREAGASWQQVGDALGISRQAAWERFTREQDDYDPYDYDAIADELD